MKDFILFLDLIRLKKLEENIRVCLWREACLCVALTHHLAGAPAAWPCAGGTGLALLPQAGVALGLALLVADRFPDLAPQILPIVVAGTILFELAGPLTTRFAVARTGEVGQGAPEEEPAC